jgi:hypothetical protein
MVWPAAARAKPSPARSAEDVLDDFVAAVGGPMKKALVYTKSRLVVRFAVGDFAGDGVEEAWVGIDRSRFIVTSPYERSEAGCERRGCWAIGPTGLFVPDGAREAERRLQLTHVSLLAWKATYPVRQLADIPADAPEGISLECVRLSHPRVSERTACFDATTHLLVYYETTDQRGKRQRDLLSDYRWVGGRRFWFRREHTEGAEVKITQLREVTLDPRVVPAVFRMPRLKPTL